MSHQLTGLVEQLTGVEERLSKLEVSQNRPDDEAPERAGSRQPDHARNAHGGSNHSNSNVEDFLDKCCYEPLLLCITTPTYDVALSPKTLYNCTHKSLKSISNQLL